MPIKDYSGMKFGHLTAIDFSHLKLTPHRRRFWNCLCECGKIVKIPTTNLTSGNSKSCGCMRLENIQTHGHSSRKKYGLRSPEYSVYMQMKSRCNRKSDNNYHRYGGRGIKVCQRWMESFENFLADMGLKPPGHSIERINNNGNYEPGNCRWATRPEQNRNKRTNVFLTAFGKTQCVNDWALELGIPDSTIGARLKAGKSPEKALSKNFLYSDRYQKQERG